MMVSWIKQGKLAAMESMNRGAVLLLPTLLALCFACAALMAAGPESATEYAQQEKDLRAALDKAQTSQGEDAEATLKAMSELSECLQHRGKLPEAETLLRTIIERKGKSTPADGLPMAEVYDRLGSVLTDMKQFEEAWDFLQKALKIHEKANHTSELDYALVISDLGKVKLAQDKHAEAEPLFRRSLDLQKGMYANDSPILPPAYANLASALGPVSIKQWDEARMKEAEDLFRRALEIEKNSGSGTRQRESLYMDNLACHLRDMGRLTEAEQLMRQAMAIDVKLFGDVHPDTAVRLQHMGSVVARLERFVDAEPYLSRAVESCSNYWGQDSLQTADACHDLGKVLMRLNRIKDAEEKFRRALAIREKLLGPDHVDVAKSLYNVACVELSKGKTTEAEPMMKRVLAIDEKAYGLNDLTVAEDLGFLARVQLALRKYLAAETTQRRVLDIVVTKLGREHQRSVMAAADLADILLSQSRTKEAEALIRENRDLVARTFGGDHPLLAVWITLLAAIQAQDGRAREAEYQCRRALIILGQDEKKNGFTSGFVPRAIVNYVVILDMLGLSVDQIRERVKIVRDCKDPGPVPKPQPARGKPRSNTSTV